MEEKRKDYQRAVDRIIIGEKPGTVALSNNYNRNTLVVEVAKQINEKDLEFTTTVVNLKKETNLTLNHAVQLIKNGNLLLQVAKTNNFSIQNLRTAALKKLIISMQ